MRHLWNFSFVWPRGCLTNPFRTLLSLCFRVIDKTLDLISCNNYVIKISHQVNVLAKCDSIFLLLRCQGVWDKTCTPFSLPNPLSESKELQSWGCMKILLSFLMWFNGHFWPTQQQQQCLPQFKSILDGCFSLHLPQLPSVSKSRIPSKNIWSVHSLILISPILVFM